MSVSPVSPLAAIARRGAELCRTLAAERAAERSAVVPPLAALLAGEPLPQDERWTVALEVLRGWRAAATRGGWPG